MNLGSVSSSSPPMIEVALINGTTTQARLQYTYTDQTGKQQTKAWRVELKQGGTAQNLTNQVDRINRLAKTMIIDNPDSLLKEALLESHKNKAEFRIAKSDDISENKKGCWKAEIVGDSSLTILIPENISIICNDFFPSNIEAGGIHLVRQPESRGFLKKISAWLFSSNGPVEVPQSFGFSTPIKKYITSSDGRTLEQSTYKSDLIGYMKNPERGADQAKQLIEQIQASKKDLDLEKMIYDNDGISYGESVKSSFKTDIGRGRQINVIENSVDLRVVHNAQDISWFTGVLQGWFPCEHKSYEFFQDRNQTKLNYWLCMHMLTQGGYGLILQDLKTARGCKEGEELDVDVIGRTIEKTESGSIEINCKLELGIRLPAGPEDDSFKLKANSKYPAGWRVTFPSPSEKPQLSMTVSKPSLNHTHETLGGGFMR